MTVDVHGPAEAIVTEVAGLAPELAGAKKGQGSKPLASASERFTSYDVDAFEVPGGREENWRFTPMRRLHGLHDGSAAFDGTAADRRRRRSRGRPSRRSAATIPGSVRAAFRPTGSPPRPGRPSVKPP